MLKWSKSAFQTRGVSCNHGIAIVFVGIHWVDILKMRERQESLRAKMMALIVASVESEADAGGSAFQELAPEPREKQRHRQQDSPCPRSRSRIQIPWMAWNGNPNGHKQQNRWDFRRSIERFVWFAWFFPNYWTKSTRFAGEDLSELSVHIEKTSTMKSLNKWNMTSTWPQQVSLQRQHLHGILDPPPGWSAEAVPRVHLRANHSSKSAPWSSHIESLGGPHWSLDKMW